MDLEGGVNQKEREREGESEEGAGTLFERRFFFPVTRVAVLSQHHTQRRVASSKQAERKWVCSRNFAWKFHPRCSSNVSSYPSSFVSSRMQTTKIMHALGDARASATWLTRSTRGVFSRTTSTEICHSSHIARLRQLRLVQLQEKQFQREKSLPPRVVR